MNFYLVGKSGFSGSEAMCWIYKTNCVETKSTGYNELHLSCTESYDPAFGGNTRKGGVPLLLLRVAQSSTERTNLNLCKIFSQKKGELELLFVILFDLCFPFVMSN